MDKIKLEILGLSSSQSEVGHFALVLGEVNGNRRLPIIIDGFQARAIALEIESIKPNRPMTHDLFVAFSKSFGIELLEVIITELREGIFYARLVFEQDGDIHEIDSRTSDAVAVGVRFQAPIYTFESVLGMAGIEVKDSDLGETAEFLDDEDEDEFEDDEEMEEAVESQPTTLSDQIKKLQDQMDEAIAREDYERAARIRDEITRLEGK